MGINRSSAELDALRGEVRQWLAEVISQPYGGPGFQRSGPICPYTSPAAANGELLVEVHEGLDGSDRVAVRDFIAESVNRFCATISRDRWQAAMVIGLPDMLHTFGDDFEEIIINDEMGTWRQQRHAMASAFYNEVPNPTGPVPHHGAAYAGRIPQVVRARLPRRHAAPGGAGSRGGSAQALQSAAACVSGGNVAHPSDNNDRPKPTQNLVCRPA
jgi:hypothetical protein